MAAENISGYVAAMTFYKRDAVSWVIQRPSDHRSQLTVIMAPDEEPVTNTLLASPLYWSRA